MKYLYILIGLFYHATISATSDVDLIINVENRQTITLNGKWHYIIDPYETGFYDYRYLPYDQNSKNSGNPSAFYNNAKPKSIRDRIEYDFDKSETLLVPGDWNSQKEKLLYYEGTIWYKRSFDYAMQSSNQRVYVWFGGVNYQADVYLNGTKLGRHVGGFTPFNFEITSLLKEEDNYLVLKVDNKRSKDGVPTLNTDWWNYGGITRDVKLVTVPQTYVKDYMIQLEQGTSDQIGGYLQLDGPSLTQPVTIEIPEAGIKYTINPNSKGRAELAFKAKRLKLWSPESPKLYEVIISSGEERLTEHIGFRTVQTKDTDILINGKSIFLRGICIHEENGMRGGRAFSKADAQMVLNWAKELGCNFVRLAHYPHNEHIIRLADQMGIMVWEEIPVYWTINWQNESTLRNAVNQLSEVITRDRNRASVIIWSMANETPVGESRNKFLRSLMSQARKMDPTRLVSAALEKHAKKGEKNVMVIEDPIAKDVDVLGFNQYIGWYGGTPESCKDVRWEISHNKPVIVTEFGAGALQGLRGSKDERWTEDYQENLYLYTLKMIDRIPQLRGVTPWILADFRSPKRVLPVIQDGWNRKGLISETGTKKRAFFILQEFYEIKQKQSK